MSTDLLAHETALQIIQLCKRWYQGRSPCLFIVEDEPEPQRMLEARFKKAFPDVGLSIDENKGFARSVDGVRNAFHPHQTAGKSPYDVLILDHRILAHDDQQQFASDKNLREMIEYLVRIRPMTWRALIRVTAYVAEAQHLERNLTRGNGDHSQALLTTDGCLIEKDPGKWVDLVLAYVYRTLVLEECVQLTQQFARFNFEQLSGGKSMMHLRGQMNEMEEFGEFLQRLEQTWPLLKHWPEDALQTRAQLDGLMQLTERHFQVDESQVNLDAGVGRTRLCLRSNVQIDGGRLKEIEEAEKRGSS